LQHVEAQVSIDRKANRVIDRKRVDSENIETRKRNQFPV